MCCFLYKSVFQFVGRSLCTLHMELVKVCMYQAPVWRAHSGLYAFTENTHVQITQCDLMHYDNDISPSLLPHLPYSVEYNGIFYDPLPSYTTTIIIDIKADISWSLYRCNCDIILTLYWYCINGYQYHIDILWYLSGQGYLTNTMSYYYILLLSLSPDLSSHLTVVFDVVPSIRPRPVYALVPMSHFSICCIVVLFIHLLDNIPVKMSRH
jgi:hypothetical protein